MQVTHPGFAEGGQVGDGVEFEVVDVAAELEQHPLHQLARREAAAAAALGWRSRSLRQASPMMPLESSARAMTLIALASALWVTE